MPELTVRVYKSSDSQLKANKVYREKNRQKIRDIAKKYYEANKTIVRAKRMIRYHAQKELRRVRQNPTSSQVESGDSPS